MKQTKPTDNKSYNSFHAGCLRDLYLDGMASGKADCIIETLSEYGRVPAGLCEKIAHQKDPDELSRLFTLARQSRSIDEFIFRM